MKSSALVFLFVTACGPAFQSDLFGDQDAGIHNETGATYPELDATSKEVGRVEDDTGSPTVVSDAPPGLDNDAASDAGLDAPAEACSCAELCSGAYPLRVCESCYLETCPTWEGGLPQ